MEYLDRTKQNYTYAHNRTGRHLMAPAWSIMGPKGGPPARQAYSVTLPHTHYIYICPRSLHRAAARDGETNLREGERNTQTKSSQPPTTAPSSLPPPPHLTWGPSSKTEVATGTQIPKGAWSQGPTQQLFLLADYLCIYH